MKKKIQKKVEKKYNSGLVGGLIVLCLVTILGFGAAVVAYSGSASTVFEGDCVDCTIEASSGDFGNFGAIDLPTRSDFSGFTDLNITSELRFGNNDKLTDGYSLGFKVIDLNATSSATQLNNTGETLYVYDAYFRIQTATTTGFEGKIGTSSIAFLAPDNACGADDTCGSATAGDASILLTGDIAASTVAGTTFFKADYQGTDTRDGSNDRFIVPVLDGEYFLCTASSTVDRAMGTFQSQCVVKFYTLDD